MKTQRTTILSNQKGWVVYFDDGKSEFYPFTATEAYRLIDFLSTEVAGVRLDYIVAERAKEVAKVSAQLDALQP